MVRGEARLPSAAPCFGNFLVPDLRLFDEVGPSAWTASDLLSSASIFVMRRRRRCCTGSQWRCRAQDFSVKFAECSAAAESETLRRPAVGASLEPRVFWLSSA